MNETIFHFFYQLANKSESMDKLIVFLADKSLPIIFIAAGVFVLMHHEIFRAENPLQIFRQKYREILIVFAAALSAWVLAHVIKLLFPFPRPFEILEGVSALFGKTGGAFPSGHSALLMALAVSIYFYHKKAGYIFMGLAMISGIARIAAGVHFPIDILGGFALGALVAWGLFVWQKKSF